MGNPKDQLFIGPLLVESLSLGRESTHPVAGERLSLTRLLVAAVEETGLSEKDAAISQGYDPRYWPRIKSGEKAAHLDRIAGLPLRTQQDFIRRWALTLRLRVTDDDVRARVIAELARAAVSALTEIA